MASKTSRFKMRSKKLDSTELQNYTLAKEAPYKGITGNGWTSDKLKLAMWNVNGIRSVMNKKYLYYFVQKYAPDIFCLNQTKIDKEMFEKSPISFAGYNSYWNFSKISAGYSGVAIFSKYLPLSIFEDLQQAQFSQQGRVLTLEFDKFYIVAVYIPSAGGKQLERLDYKVKFYMPAFESYCEKLKLKGKGVIVCGDMNVACQQLDINLTPNSHKQPGYTPKQRKCFKKILAKGWIDTYRKFNPAGKQFTWWRTQYGCRQKNIGKRLDYFLVNDSFIDVVQKSIVLGDVMGSDHCPVYMQVDLTKNKLQQSEEKQQKQQKQQNFTQSKEKLGEETRNLQLNKTEQEEDRKQSPDLSLNINNEVCEEKKNSQVDKEKNIKTQSS